MNRKPTSGFTLIELLVVIAVVAVLASILFPVLGQAKGRAYQTKCLSNLKALGWACLMYTDDWKGLMPHPGGNTIINTDLEPWDMHVNGGVDSYLRNKSAGDTVWRCPGGIRPSRVADDGKGASMGRSYTMNDYLRPWNFGRDAWPHIGLNSALLENASRTIMIFETFQESIPEAYAYRNGSPHFDVDSKGEPLGMPMCNHKGKMNVVFCDGHAAAVFPPDTWTDQLYGRYVLKPQGRVFYRVKGNYHGLLPDMWVPFVGYTKYPSQ